MECGISSKVCCLQLANVMQREFCMLKRNNQRVWRAEKNGLPPRELEQAMLISGTVRPFRCICFLERVRGDRKWVKYLNYNQKLTWMSWIATPLCSYVARRLQPEVKRLQYDLYVSRPRYHNLLWYIPADSLFFNMICFLNNEFAMVASR